MAAIKTVTFKEKELIKEGISPKGIPWARFNYYGDDGEHYQLFGSLDLERPYQLTQETRTGKDGKSYTNWVVVKEGKGGGGGGVKLIMDKLDGVLAEIQDLKRQVTEVHQAVTGPILSPKRSPKDVDLPF